MPLGSPEQVNLGSSGLFNTHNSDWLSEVVNLLDSC